MGMPADFKNLINTRSISDQYLIDIDWIILSNSFGKVSRISLEKTLFLLDGCSQLAESSHAENYGFA
jgi:hypothetical protein